MEGKTGDLGEEVMRRLIFGLWIVASAPLWGLETSLAEFSVTSEVTQGEGVSSEQFHADLLSALVALDTKGAIGFRSRPSSETGGLVTSTLEAARVAEINGWETVVYGQLVQRVTSLDVEIRIYSHPARDVVKTFLVRSTHDDYESLLVDCAQKIYGFFAQGLYLAQSRERYTAESNSWITDHGALWWGTLGAWSEVFVPVVGYRGAYGLRFGDPLWTNGEWALVAQLGVQGEFWFALHQPEVIPSRLYDAVLGPVFTTNLVWQRQQEAFLSVVPAARIHFLNYQPLHEDTQWAASAWYGGVLEAGYRFWANAQRTWGVGVVFGGSMFAAEPLYADFRLGLSLAWKGGLE